MRMLTATGKQLITSTGIFKRAQRDDRLRLGSCIDGNGDAQQQRSTRILSAETLDDNFTTDSAADVSH